MASSILLLCGASMGMACTSLGGGVDLGAGGGEGPLACGGVVFAGGDGPLACGGGGAAALEVVGLLLQALGTLPGLGRPPRGLGQLEVRLVEVPLRLGHRLVVLLQVVLLGVVAACGEEVT